MRLCSRLAKTATEPCKSLGVLDLGHHTKGGFQMAGHIEDWSDERGLGHGIIVTLKPGWSFDWSSHEGVRGFDTVTEARRETRRKHIHLCDPECPECAGYRDFQATTQEPDDE